MLGLSAYSSAASRTVGSENIVKQSVRRTWVVVFLKKSDHPRESVQSVFTKKKSSFLKIVCNFFPGLSCGPTFVGKILECLDECFIEKTFDLQHPFVVKKCSNFKFTKNEKIRSFWTAEQLAHLSCKNLSLCCPLTAPQPHALWGLKTL